jgi:hypothetical protein
MLPERLLFSPVPSFYAEQRAISLGQFLDRIFDGTPNPFPRDYLQFKFFGAWRFALKEFVSIPG